MNIFVLDKDPKTAASYHCDRHVVKMVLESAQIMSTVLRTKYRQVGYRSTHKNHPCCRWAAESYGNFQWLSNLALELSHEYTYRFTRIHASEQVIRECINETSSRCLFDCIEQTPFRQAMPIKYQNSNDAVAAYRRYYVGGKKDIATWKHGREMPEWYSNGLLWISNHQSLSDWNGVSSN